MTEYIETVVVGGGQAGLSASWHLKRSGREHVVLDKGRIGDTWRNRWELVLSCHSELALSASRISI